jgi:TonB family protein
MPKSDLIHHPLKLLLLLCLAGMLGACAGRAEPPASREFGGEDFPGKDSVLTLLTDTGYADAAVEQQFLRSLASPGLVIRLTPMDAEASRGEVHEIMAALAPLIQAEALGAVVFQVSEPDDNNREPQGSRPLLFDHGFYRDSLRQWSYLGNDPAGYFQRRLRDVQDEGDADPALLLHLHAMRGGIALYQNFPVLARHHLGEASRLLSEADPETIPQWLALLATRYRLHLALSSGDRTLFGEVLPQYAMAVQNTPGGPEDMVPIVRVQPAQVDTVTANRRRVGYVLFEFTVTANGRVRDIEVVQSNLGFQFRDAATRALRGFAYEPRIENGLPVDTPGVRYRFEFGASR